MRLDAAAARQRFGTAPVARLATASPDGQPHLVPIVFAVEADVIYTAVDAKPKSTSALRRLSNITENPPVAVLVDHYDDDWTRLWWVRADGVARIADADDAAAGRQLLVERYPQYSVQPPPGPVIAIDVTRWSGWRAQDD